MLICDWSSRAWTFLESNRGCDNILLCKDDLVASLRRIQATIRQWGDISTANLMLTTQQLVPTQGVPEHATSSDGSTSRAHGFVSIHEASCLSGHRHASRENDEVIIWSLLCGDEAKETAIDL